MAKPSRYMKEEIDGYVKSGYWKTTISSVWDQNAISYPNKDAIEDLRTTLTWAEAKQWTDRVALNLLELGIKRDEVVVIQLPNCFELHLLRIACEKAGVLCVPVTANMREREMQHILKFTSASVVVIPWKYRKFDHLDMIEDIRSGLPRLRHIFVVSDEVPEGVISVRKLAQEPLSNEERKINYLQKRSYKPAEVSIINVTSGTTGLPKFVEYPAGANAAWGEGQAPILKLTTADVVAAVAPAARGPCLPVYYDAPWVAAKIAMLPWNGPEEALKAIEAKQGTVVCLVPTQLVRMMEQFKLGNYDLSSVRVWYSAGAIMPPFLVREVEESIGGIVISDYGAVDFGGMIMPGLDDPQEVRMFSVGKPRFGTESKLVDDSGEEVGVGETGEVLGRGPTCSSGYFKDPKTSSEAWDRNGWFAMGDLGKIDEQGNLAIVRRKKDMIIRGGQNIYPSEIETLLINHPKIQDVAIVGMPDPVMEERACAYVVPKKEEAFTFGEMVAFLKEKKLSPFKLPERLEIVDELPLTPQHKVDKQMLKDDIAKKIKAEKKEGTE